MLEAIAILTMLAAAAAVIYAYLGLAGLLLFGGGILITALADALAMALTPPSAASASAPRANPRAMTAIVVSWNLPAVLLLCAGPGLWPYFSLVYAGACFALAGFIAVIPNSQRVRGWVFPAGDTRPKSTHYGIAGLMLLFGIGCLIDALLLR